MTYIVRELREEMEFQGICFRSGTKYPMCPGLLERTADTIEELVEALDRLADDPDDLHVRQDAREALAKARGR